MIDLTFDKLPEAVNQLSQKLNSIEQLLLETKSEKFHSQDDLLTIQEASSFLKLSVPTLYLKVSKREICFQKKGKRLYFLKSDLLTWIKSGRSETGTEIREQIGELILKRKGGKR